MQGFGIEDVIAALVGAVFGATANGWVSGWRDQRQKRRELSGLLRLIATEIHHNTIIIESYNDGSKTYTEAVAQLRADTWDRVCDRLAQLLPREEDLRRLLGFYAQVQMLQIAPDQPPPDHLDMTWYADEVEAIARKYRRA